MFWHNFLQIGEQYVFYDLKEATMNKVRYMYLGHFVIVTLTTMIVESNKCYHQCQQNLKSSQMKMGINSTSKGFFIMNLLLSWNYESFLYSLFLKGTRNERKVLATSPRSDLHEYKSDMPSSKAPKTMKRPCEGEPEVKFCQWSQHLHMYQCTT